MPGLMSIFYTSFCESDYLNFMFLLVQELQIEFSQYEHPVVLTVEAQAKYVGDKGGALSKNLFLKDKKSRFYIVSALVDTKVDLKVLAQRLGLGKGGMRMAPQEALGEILQVPLGSVTPFALINESARNVSLLLDKGFQTQVSCFFHPLSNDTSISLNARDLDKFLKSIGRDPSYVDLEANPPVGKDQPPDLASLVPSGSVVLPDHPEKEVPLQGSKEIPVSAEKKSTTSAVKATKSAKVTQNTKNKPAEALRQPSAVSDAGLFIEEILNKMSTLLLSEITEHTIEKHGAQLGTVVAGNIQKRLNSDLNSSAVMFKNTAYTQGFCAGTSSVSKRLGL